MARFHFNLRSLLAHASGAHRSVAQCTLIALNLAPRADVPHGPGWFDSSWDLTQGLEVREGLPADARPNEWLEHCVRSERRQAPVDAFAGFGIDGLTLA